MSEIIRLLFVDDEREFLDVLAERLEARGFDVRRVSDGKEALAVAETEQFDLALVDLQMPGVSGQQVLEVLRLRHEFIEIIILTGHATIDSAVACTKLGAFDYLTKPFDFENLLAVLKGAFEQRLRRKFAHDQRRQEELTRLATGGSPLDILHRMREMDTEDK